MHIKTLKNNTYQSEFYEKAIGILNKLYKKTKQHKINKNLQVIYIYIYS